MAQPVRKPALSVDTLRSRHTSNTTPRKPMGSPTREAMVSRSLAMRLAVSAISSGWVPMMRLPIPAETWAKPKAEPRLYPIMPMSEMTSRRGQSCRSMRQPPNTARLAA